MASLRRFYSHFQQTCYPMYTLTKSKFLFPLFLLLGIVHSPYAQDIGNPLAWNRVHLMGGSDADAGSDVIANGQGDIFLVGTFSGRITLGNTELQSNGQREAFVARFNPAGQLQWVKTFGSDVAAGEVFGQNIALDNAGNVVVSGAFRNGNLKAGALQADLKGLQDLYTVKMDPDGNLLWLNAQYHAPGESLVSRSLLTDQQGDVYLMSNLRTYKFTAGLGTTSWTIDDPNIINGALALHNDTLYLGGVFEDGAAIGNTVLYTPSAGIFISRVNTQNGSLSAVRKLAETSEYYTFLNLNALLVRNDTEIYASGHFRRDLTAGACSLNPANFTRQHAFVFRSNGTTCDWLLGQSESASLSSSSNRLVWDGQGALWLSGNWVEYFTLGAKSLVGGNGGYAGKIDPATGEVLALESAPAVSGLATYDQGGALLTGSDGFSAYWSRLDANGDELERKAFDNDGGLSQIGSLEADESGIYLTATVSGRFQLADLMLETGETSALIARVSLDGTQVLWHKLIPGAQAEFQTIGNSGFLDKERNRFYCFVSNTREVVLNGQTYPVSNGTHLDFLLLGLDADGNLDWIQPLYDLVSINNLAVDRAGNVLAGGVFGVATQIGNTQLIAKGDWDFFIAKWNPASGDLLWAKRGGGADTEYSAILATDAANNIYLASETYSLDIDLDDEVLINSLDLDGNILLARLDPDGNVIWKKLYGKASNFSDEFRCFPASMSADAGGNMYVAGLAGRNNSFGHIQLNSPYSTNQFAGKFDPSGEPIWVSMVQTKRISLNYTEVDYDEAGNLYCAGQIRDSTFFGNNAVALDGSTLARNGYFARYDGASGTLDWVAIVSGSPDAQVTPTCMAVFDQNSVLHGGFLTDMVSFGAVSLNTFSGVNGFLGLMGQDVMVSVDQPAEGALAIRLFPNPATRYLLWQAPEDTQSGNLSVSLVNSAGQTVWQGNYSAPATCGRIELANLLPGVYYFHWNSGRVQQLKKVIVH